MPDVTAFVQHPSDWPWSSYPCTIGGHAAPKWLETDWLLSQFYARRSMAIRAYQAFVDDGIGLDSVWSDLRSQIFLGSETFVEQMHAKMPDKDLREIPRRQRRGSARPLSDYAKNRNRQEAMALAYRTGDYTLQRIADYFGVHYSTVSRAVRASENDR